MEPWIRMVYCMCDGDGWWRVGTAEGVWGQVLHPPLLSLSIWHIQHYCRAIKAGFKRRHVEQLRLHRSLSLQYQTGVS